MSVVVDTSVFSAPLIARRKAGTSLEDQYRRHLIGQTLVIATQTLAELYYGAEVAGWGEARRQRLGRHVANALVVAPDDATLTALTGTATATGHGSTVSGRDRGRSSCLAVAGRSVTGRDSRGRAPWCKFVALGMTGVDGESGQGGNAG